MRCLFNKNNRRVVITGIGVIAPNGIGKDVFWKNSMQGQSGIMELPFAKQHQFKSTIGGCVQDFKVESSLSKLYPDRYMQFALIATDMALKDATLNLTDINKEKMGVSISNAIAGTKRMEEDFLKLTSQGRNALDLSLTPLDLFKATSFNSLSMEIANLYQLGGPSCTLPTGCVGGLDSIGFCLDIIRSGDANIMIAGASEAPLTPMVMAAFDAIGALSSKYNQTPEKASRPYDVTRDGFVLGESCGILILEEREHALKRRASILAEVKGYGTTCNAYHMTGLPDDGVDLARAIEIALDDAAISMQEIDYINSHGSSTPQNDANETAAYKLVFKRKAYDIPISSLKSMCGHALAAANAIETIATVCSIVHQEIHPTLNYSQFDPNCDLNYVSKRGKKHVIRHALKNASGFSGIHSAIVLSHPNG